MFLLLSWTRHRRSPPMRRLRCLARMQRAPPPRSSCRRRFRGASRAWVISIWTLFGRIACAPAAGVSSRASGRTRSTLRWKRRTVGRIGHPVNRAASSRVASRSSPLQARRSTSQSGQRPRMPSAAIPSARRPRRSRHQASARTRSLSAIRCRARSCSTRPSARRRPPPALTPPRPQQARRASGHSCASRSHLRRRASTPSHPAAPLLPPQTGSSRRRGTVAPAGGKAPAAPHATRCCHRWWRRCSTIRTRWRAA